MIGIVGGIGPLAGVDMYKQIIANTIASKDQDHLPVMLASLPGEIADRVLFLLEGNTENPALGISKAVRMLESSGANLIAIACNTAHAPAIFEPMLQNLKAEGSTVEIINLIEVTVQEIIKQRDAVQCIGILSTIGTYKAGIFQDALKAVGLVPVLLPFEAHEALVQKSVFSIKLSGDSVEDKAILQINTAIRELQKMGAQAILLGCTEIAMIESLLDFRRLPAINPNTIMDRTLISRYKPEQLKPKHLLNIRG